MVILRSSLTRRRWCPRVPVHAKPGERGMVSDGGGRLLLITGGSAATVGRLLPISPRRPGGPGARMRSVCVGFAGPVSSSSPPSLHPATPHSLRRSPRSKPSWMVLRISLRHPPLPNRVLGSCAQLSCRNRETFFFLRHRIPPHS